MIVDFVEPEKLPDFIVWLDWWLYAHGGIYITMVISVLVYRLFIPEKYRQSVGESIIIATIVFSILMYIKHGNVVG